jgi:hypothetical protein
VAGQYFPGDTVLRAAVGPALTTQETWAVELVHDIVQDVAANLLSESVLIQLRQRSGLGYAFADDQGGIIKVPIHAPTPSGAFVGEGKPIPGGVLLLTGVSLPPRKAASMVGLTREILQGSPGNVEQSIKTLLEQDLRLTIDGILLGAGAGDTDNPLGLLNGVVGLTPSASATVPEKIGADVKALVSAIAPAMRPVLIANSIQAATLGVHAPGLAGQVISAPYLTAGTVIAIDAAAFVSALGAVEFVASEEAVIHENTAPLPLVGGTTQPPALGSVAAPQRSLWQTASTGLRTLIFTNWALRRTGAVAFMAGVGW